MAVELLAGNVWVGTLTRNGPGVARTRALGTDRRPKDRDLAYQLQTIADSEDWRLYRGTTLGAATLVKARLYPKGCTWDAPAACRRGYPNLPGTPGGCRLAGTGPMRSPGGGTPEVQDLVSDGGAECGDKAQWTRTMGEWAAWQKRWRGK